MSPDPNGSTGPNPITDHLDLWSSATQQKATVGRGKNGKTSPHGINKLRELILELAVRGKLVPQDPNDEPASVLLEKIAEEKKQLVKEKKIKKQKALPTIADEEKLFELPIGWEWARLGDICKKLTDGSHNPPPNAGEGYPMLSSQNVNYEKIDFSSPSRFVTEADFIKEDQRTSIQPFDVLLNIVASIGRSAVVPINAPKFVLQRSVAVLDSTINSHYFAKMLVSPLCLQYYDKHAKGTAQKGIYLGKLSMMALSIPPAEEQSRINQKVDDLMALCDQLEQQQTDSLHAHQTLVRVFLDRLIDQANTRQPFHTELIDAFDTLFTTEESIDQLKQTILQLAVMGKLVPQNPNDEPASVLLEKIAAEKARLIKDKKIKKQKPLPPISDEEKPFELPAGWEWVFLNPLITVMDAGWSPACPPEKSPADNVWGVLKTTAVQTMEYRQDENKVLSASKIPRPQYEVNPGDILITRAGPKNRVGISCLVEATRPNLMISDKIIRFHLVNGGMSERFISLCFNAGATADYLERSKSGMAESQMNISQDKLKSAPIPLCPIEEQHRIVAKVDELMALCDTIKARLNEAQTTQAQLADAVVERAVG
jgi:type I restriction enzyme S subunit